MKKLLSVLLAGCMLIAFAGCKDKGKSGTKDPSKLTSADVDAETFKGLKFETDPDLDFGGKTVTIVRDTIPKEGTSALYDREIAVKEAMEEKYNVKIEWIEGGSTANASYRDNIVTSYVSGGAYADIVFSTSSLMLTLLSNEGIFRPLDDYIDFSNERFALTHADTQYIDGKHYSYYPTKVECGYMIYYNTELIAENNCDDPRELYEQGEWNWKTFEEIAKACTTQKNGKNIYGLAGSNILDGILASNGLTLLTHKDGKVECSFYTDAGQNALEFLRTLAYTDKAVDGTYGSHNGIETFNNGFAAMVISPQYYGSHFTSSGIPFDVVPLPMGDDTDSYTNVCQYRYCYSISANSEYETEDLLQLAFELERNDPALGETVYHAQDEEGLLADFIEQYMDQETDYFDDDQATFTFKFINDEKTVNTVEWLTNDIKNVIITNVYNPISKGEAVRSQLDSVKSVIQTAIDKQF